MLIACIEMINLSFVYLDAVCNKLCGLYVNDDFCLALVSYRSCYKIWGGRGTLVI